MDDGRWTMDGRREAVKDYSPGFNRQFGWRAIFQYSSTPTLRPPELEDENEDDDDENEALILPSWSLFGRPWYPSRSNLARRSSGAARRFGPNSWLLSRRPFAPIIPALRMESFLRQAGFEAPG